jgi:glycosyltransferase involved in cell wall biosynthesis
MVSVVVPAFDAATTIDDQLAALEGQDYDGDWEIVVADNGSRDGTPDLVRGWSARLPQLRLIEVVDGRGQAPARNGTVAAGRGDLLAFCDADDVVTRSWLRALVEAALTSDAVGGGIDPHRLNDPVAVAWRMRLVADDHLSTALDFLPFSQLANLAVWRDAFDHVGGIPPYDGAGEDVAFSWRIQLAGFRLTYAPEAVVHYRLRSDLVGTFRQWHHYGIASARLYREFRPVGVERRSLLEPSLRWLGLVRDITHPFRGAVLRGKWMVRLAYLSGAIRGAIRYRVLFAG